jgi:hypothetical protein
MAKPITGNLDEFERLLKFADNDFFNISMTFSVLNRIAGRIELSPPLFGIIWPSRAALMMASPNRLPMRTSWVS